MYKFSIYDFSNREIDQICELVRMQSNGYILPVKRANLTKNVIEYAINWKLLEVRGNRLYFPQFSGFNVSYDLPIEVLWRMVSPMLNAEGSTGYSVVNNKLWSDLNIYPQNSRHASDRDIEEKTNIMLKLSNYHYINFQLAGDVWSIYREVNNVA